MILLQPHSSRWYMPYFDAFFTAVTGGYLLYNAATFLPEKQAAFFTTHLAMGYRYLFFCAILCIVYTVMVNKRERAGKFNAEKAHAIFFGLIRYGLAASICCYGFAKILGMQFKGADEIILRDSLLGDVGGNYLTWYYFNFSPAFTLMIGYLQIAGSLLLLFRRSTLAGIFLLLPVMVTIALIDLFYRISPTPTIIAFVFTATLFYLLLLHRQRLVELFFKTVYALPTVATPTVKNVLRIAAIAFAFMSIYHSVLTYRETSQPVNAALRGKWTVEQSSMNGKEILSNAWQTDPGRWGAIYFFRPGYCAVSSNPYYFDRADNNFGKYQFDSLTHTIRIYFLKTSDSLVASVAFPAGNTLLIKGLLGRDSIIMQLRRVKM